MLLCVCGGYQAHTVPGFVVALLRHFADDVQVVLSRSAATLVARDAVEVASRNPVFVEMTDRAAGIYVPHIELTRGADLVLVYPATVNLIGKLANGIADELIPAHAARQRDTRSDRACRQRKHDSAPGNPTQS